MPLPPRASLSSALLVALVLALPAAPALAASENVAALQVALGAHGLYARSIDGIMGPATRRAVRRFQSCAGLAVDGVAGSGTIAALQRGGPAPIGGGPPSGPVRFLRPVQGRMGDGFGWRWGRMHTGVDFPVPAGTRVAAAGRGVTTFAGWSSGGYGNLVVIRHRLGFESWYAHLSSVTSWPGERVVGGTRIGYVGSTGHATGPHLHFEVRVGGQPIDPLPRLLGITASAFPRLGAAARLDLGCTDDCPAR
jgi:murein DD-endopeptidase MepM/ murein hydrolase activator NlpD